MTYRREINLSTSIDITVKDKDMSIGEIFDFTERKDLDYVFRFCLSVLLEQDAYDQYEIQEATRIISELTNHEDGFNITTQEVS
tara:strand:+ start:1664 stop:1915 length:252 start_codon:yes stop_codon:yes gene_type:complete